MGMNDAIREYAKSKLNCAADANDDTIKAAVTAALADQSLSGEKYAELLATKDKADEKSVKDELVGAIGDAVCDKLEAALGKLADKLTPKETPAPAKKDPEPADKTPELDADALAAKLDAHIEKAVGQAVRDMDKARNSGLTEWDVLKDAALADKDDLGHIRIKGAVEKWNDTKTVARREKGINTGHVMEHRGVPLDKSTERGMGMCAAWLKLQVVPHALTEHDGKVIDYILAHEKFYMPGEQDARLLSEDERHEVKRAHLQPSGFKAPLINDSTSGGENAVPEFFDHNFILLPILGGELAPLVNMVDVPVGSAADTFTLANPTFASGATEGTAVTLFDATSMIANHDTTFFRAHGGIEIGNNFLQDASPRLAQEIVNAYMRKGAEWVDEQIAIGDGTTEPQGLTVASNTVDITPANPTTGALTLTDAMNLLFGVTKAYRNDYPSRQAAFVMTDTTYKRFRSIATGVTGDTRLIFGEDVESYTMLGHPVAIVGTGLTNADVIFAQLGGYRLYRRQGLRFVRESGGQELVTSNSSLIYCDMRYGGQLDRGAYAAVMDSAPA